MAKLIKGSGVEIEEKSDDASTEQHVTEVTNNNQTTKPSHVSDGLREEADEIMGRYWSHYQRLLCVKDDRFEANTGLPEFIGDALKKIGPRIVQATPYYINESTKIKYSIIDDTSEEVKMLILASLGGDYVEQFTDLPTGVGGLGDLTGYFPELQAIKDAFAVNYTWASPLTPVFSLNPDVRDLPAVALGRRLNFGDNLPIYRNEGLRHKLLTDGFPTFKELVDVAKEYNVTEIKSTLEGLAAARELYITKWSI